MHRVHDNVYHNLSCEKDPSERGPIRQAYFRGRGYPGTLSGSGLGSGTGTGFLGGGGRGGGLGRTYSGGFFGWGPGLKRPPRRVPNQWSNFPTVPAQLPKPLVPLRKILRLHPWFRLLDFLPLLNPLPYRQGYHDMTGWTLICDTQLGPKTQWKVANFDPGIACGTPGQVYDGDIPEGPIGPFGGNRRWVSFGRYTPIGIVGRMTLDEQWSRPPSPDAIPWVPPMRLQPPPLRLVPPAWLDPLPAWPYPYWPPAPPPYRLLPDRPRPPKGLDETSNWGNSRPGDPNAYDPDPKPDPKAPPGPPPRPRPPPPNVKEKKAFGPIKKRILDAWDLATETQDALDCLVDQLGKKAWRAYKRANPDGNKWHFVWENWDKIDAAEGLTCMLRNNSTDRIVGGINRAARKRGLGFGFGGTPYRRTLK